MQCVILSPEDLQCPHIYCLHEQEMIFQHGALFVVRPMEYLEEFRYQLKE